MANIDMELDTLLDSLHEIQDAIGKRGDRTNEKGDGSRGGTREKKIKEVIIILHTYLHLYL